MGWFAPIFERNRKRRIVWAKGYVVPGRNPDEFRMDDNQRLIRYRDFGNADSPYGWDFDFEPVVRGPIDRNDTVHLRPLNLQDIAATRPAAHPQTTRAGRVRIPLVRLRRVTGG